VSASYTLSRVGWRKRTLRVEVTADGPLPELVLIAQQGTVPPRSPGAGVEVARLPPGPPRRVDVPLEGAQLPWAVRLLPRPGPGQVGLMLQHPPDDLLVVR
jgi:hypothetical protein